MYTLVEEAIHFMVKANKGNRRKNESIDKSFHSMTVGMIIRNITNSEEVIAAAILHDIIRETEYGYEEIEEKFGTLVADMVADMSEDMSIPKWLDRKKEFINRMRKINDVNVINIIIADKMHDLLSDYNLLKKNGDKVWKYSKGSKNENCWLYRECYNIARKKEASVDLLKRYKSVLEEYFGHIDE